MVTLSNTYLLMYFTDVIGIAAGVAGGLMMVGRIIDTLSPSVVGAVIEKSNSRHGKYRFAIMVGAPLILILNSLLFTDIPLGGSMKVIVTCLVYAAFCISTNVTYSCTNQFSTDLKNTRRIQNGIEKFNSPNKI